MGRPRLRSVHLLVTVLLIPFTAGGACEGSYEAPLVPIEFTIDSTGNITVGLNGHLVTPLGTFGLKAAADLTQEPPDGATLLIIRHPVGQEMMETRYRLAVRDKLGACLDGHFSQLFSDRLVIITVRDTVSRIRLVPTTGSAVSCPDDARPAAPPPPPRQTATFKNVKFGQTAADGRAPYRLDIHFSNLRGYDCLIKWHTVYLPSNTMADRSGSLRTGALPYDEDDWWTDPLMIPAPSGNRRWGTIFLVYCPDDVYLATGQ